MSNTYSKNEIIYASVASWFLGAVIVALLFIFLHLQPMRKEAVDRGFATWFVTDNATGQTEFRWNEVDQTVHAANPDMFDKIAEPLPTK